MPPHGAAAEIKRLQRCINDLVSVVALPAVWTGGEPAQIVRTLLDTLLGMLDLDFAYARLNGSNGEQAIEMARVAQSEKLPAQPQELGELINNWLGPDPQNWAAPVRNSNGGEGITIVPLRLGLQGDIGVIAVGSGRPDFPGQTEQLVLNVARNQAAIGLQDARLLNDQKRVASELDRRVVQRTAELAATNEELKKEVTDRKRIETELRVKEERYRELFDSVPVALLEIDSRKRTEMLDDLHRQGVGDVEAYLDAHPDFERRAIDASIIKEVNQQTVELFGARDAGALIGASTARLLAMTPGALRRGTVSRFRGEKLFQHELKLQTLGHTIDVLLTVARPDVSRNFLALTDITKLKSAEDALRSSERRYRQLFEFMPIAMWQLDLSKIAELTNDLRAEGVTDLDDHFDKQPDALNRMMDAPIAVDVNEFAVKMFGAQDRSQLLGPWKSHWKTSPGTFRRGMVSLFRGEESFREETQLATLDGREINVLFAMARGMVGIVDVTDRTRALERLQRVQAEFAHAARISMLGELAASIAHEVNQPLAAIRTNSETALRWLDRAEPNAAKARELIRRNVDDARRAADIIARIRGMAAGRLPERSDLSLHDLIEESIVFLRNELQANAISVALGLAATASLVAGDRIQLQQVIVNLTINAVHAMAQSTTDRRNLLIRTELPDAGTLSCTFEDSGPGIDPRFLDRLFDSFFTTRDAGMGMGLPVSRSIVEAHGGVIKADNNSVLGGARFSFALPVKNPTAH